MAAVRWVAVLALAGCGSLKGFGGPEPPLVTFQVQDFSSPGGFRAALVWGEQWLPEPLCILPPESGEAAAVIAAGCRDPFGFVPARVAADAELAIDGTATLELDSLPGSDVLVGDVTSRVAYASVLIYDDLDGDGTLTLARPNRLGTPNGVPVNTPEPFVLRDWVVGASFVTMTRSDQRIAYREGTFNETAAFYPRAGCGDPPPAFSVLEAGGFSADDAINATFAGKLPLEDPGTCIERSPDAGPIVTRWHATPDFLLDETACHEPTADSTVRWREPTVDGPDGTDRVAACVHLASFGGPPSDVLQLVLSGRSDDSCKGLTHYVLKGCREDPNCAVPDWDHSLAPPTWWPCGP